VNRKLTVRNSAVQLLTIPTLSATMHSVTDRQTDRHTDRQTTVSCQEPIILRAAEQSDENYFW